MKTLTAANQKVQIYLTYSAEKPSTKLKEQRLNHLENTLLEKNLFLNEVFPNKQRIVLDYIFFITTAKGIAKVGCEKIANRCNVSVRTVKTVVKKLKEMDELVVARLLSSTGGAGKYIFVDRKHINFKTIMSEVFSLSDVEISLQFAQQKNEKNLDTYASINQKNSFNYINNKTSKNNIYISIKNAIDAETTLSLTEQEKRIKDYATNENQLRFFEIMVNLKDLLADEIINNLYKLALTIGHEATINEVHIAKLVLLELNNRILDCSLVITTSIRALFEERYMKRLKGISNIQVDPIPFKGSIYVKSEFYNWLEERE